jgi:ribonuclease R
MLIEEFMVLANEEVAKWCDGHGIPFLSRVHGLPPYNSLEVIKQILSTNPIPPLVRGSPESRRNISNGQNLSLHRNDRNPKNSQKVLEPRHIREFLDTLFPDEAYKYSRLLLPKMAKATYSDTKHRHFGLALEYYSHFTSPIRRYPDLQVHRIIKEQLRGTLTSERIIHYKKILKKVARSCSERERTAEDIERAFDSLYACRYMANHVGETYD